MAGTKKDKETTENTEHAEKQIDFFREFRAFRSRQKLIVVERLSGNVFQLFAVSNTEVTEVSPFLNAKSLLFSVFSVLCGLS